MKTFSIYIKKNNISEIDDATKPINDVRSKINSMIANRDVVSVDQNFNLIAFCFGPIWLIYKNIYRTLAILFLIIFTISVSTEFLNYTFSIVTLLAYSLFIGLNAGYFEEQTLIKLGYELSDVVRAEDKDNALVTYLNRFGSELIQ